MPLINTYNGVSSVSSGKKLPTVQPLLSFIKYAWTNVSFAWKGITFVSDSTPLGVLVLRMNHSHALLHKILHSLLENASFWCPRFRIQPCFSLFEKVSLLCPTAHYTVYSAIRRSHVLLHITLFPSAWECIILVSCSTQPYFLWLRMHQLKPF